MANQVHNDLAQRSPIVEDMELHVAFLGIDVDDVRNRAAHLNEVGADVATIEAKLRSIFGDGNTWVGADATAAKEELDAQVLPALAVARVFIETTAQLMISSADAQETSSAGGTGTAK